MVLLLNMYDLTMFCTIMTSFSVVSPDESISRPLVHLLVISYQALGLEICPAHQ